MGRIIIAFTAVAVCSIFSTVFAQGFTRIVKSPHPLYLMPHGDLSLICEQTQGRVVEWFHNGNKIVDGTSSGFFTSTARRDNPSVLISHLEKKDVTEAHSGIYTCSAIMDPRRPEWQRSDFNIEVKVTNDSAADLSITPNHGTADEPKDDVLLSCNVTGPDSQDMSIHWWRNDKEIKEDGDKYKIKSSQNALEVRSVDYLKDLGEYMCVFMLENGRNASETVFLRAKTYVNKFETSKNLVQGDTLTLRCDAYGYPTPSAAWLKDDKEVQVDDRTSFEDNNDVVNGTLKVKKLDYDDAGDYTCVATNDHGSHNSTIIIRVKDKFAALWPFLGICAEVLILCIIIFIYERRRAKKMAEEDAKEEADHLTNSHANREDVRQRKV